MKSVHEQIVIECKENENLNNGIKSKDKKSL